MITIHDKFDKIVLLLKSPKIRIIKINQSEIKYEYVQQCFKDISMIPKFHYKDTNSLRYDNCYYSCNIAKISIYLFWDEVRNKIIVYDVKCKLTFYIPESEQEAIKEALLNSKSSAYYLKKNEKIKNIHRKISFVLIVECLILLFMYSNKKFDDGRFTSIALNIVEIIAIQDC